MGDHLAPTGAGPSSAPGPYPAPHPHTYTVAYQNIRGLIRYPTKADGLITRHDITVLVETKTRSSQQLPVLPGFESCHLSARTSQTLHGASGGIAVFLRRAPGRQMRVWRQRPNYL